MIKAIMAIGPNGELGAGNRLCYRSLFDLQFFKFLTTGTVVVMGYNTFVSLNETPLPNRKNVIIKWDAELAPAEHVVEKKESNLLILRLSHLFKAEPKAILNLVRYLLDYSDRKDIWIIGGAKTYELFETTIEEYYITHMRTEYPEADVKFLPRCLDAKHPWNKVLFPIQYVDNASAYPIKDIIKYYR